MTKTWPLAKKQGLGFLAGVLGALAGPALAAQTPSWTFTTVDFPGFALQTAGTETLPVQINSFGDIVGGSHPPGSHGSRGFLLQDGQFTFVDVPAAGGGFGTIATGINDQGDIAGTYTETGYDYHGFVRIAGEYIRIDVPGARRTETFRIGNDQTIIGGYFDQSQRMHGCIGIRNP